MKPYFLLIGTFFLSACLTKDDSKNPTVGDLWVYDSSKSTPRWPDRSFIFKVLNDTLDILGLSWSEDSMWKVNECYRGGRKIEIDRPGDSIILVNATDSIWRGPKTFHENSMGELQSDSTDTSRIKLRFNRIANYSDCEELFSRDFNLDLRMLSTEEELYTNRIFGLNLDYSLNGDGYGYSGYSIKIEGGPTILGSYIKQGVYYDNTLASNQGSISLTIPLDSLYASVAENIKIEINLIGRTTNGGEYIYDKVVTYRIREM